MMTVRRLVRLVVVLGGLLLATRSVLALQLDNRGEIRLGLRAYTAARIATEQMGGTEEDPLSFPVSPTGHLRQNRFFLQLKLDHDIKRLAMTTKGFASLFVWLDPDTLSYSLQYRGE